MSGNSETELFCHSPKHDEVDVTEDNRFSAIAFSIKMALLPLSPVLVVVALLGCNGGSSNNDSEPADNQDDQGGGGEQTITLRGENLGSIPDIAQSVLALDVDSDGDLDIVALSDDGAWIYTNISLSQDPQFSLPVLYYRFSRNSSYRVLYDLDADGDLDALANAGADYSEPVQVWYEENVGSNDNPIYQSNDQLLTENRCTGDWMGSDSGNEHTLSLIDVDSDGDLDLFIGEKGGDMDSGHFGYCENIGSASSPQFAEAVIDAPFGLSASNTGTNFIAFGDSDLDGDQDAWVNHSNFDSSGDYLDFSVFENTGTTVSPSFVRLETVTASEQAPPTQSHGFPIQGCNRPYFADFNRDNVLDSVCPNGMNVSFLLGGEDQ